PLAQMRAQKARPAGDHGPMEAARGFRHVVTPPGSSTAALGRPVVVLTEASGGRVTGLLPGTCGRKRLPDKTFLRTSSSRVTAVYSIPQTTESGRAAVCRPWLRQRPADEPYHGRDRHPQSCGGA